MAQTATEQWKSDIALILLVGLVGVVCVNHTIPVKRIKLVGN